MLTPKTKQSASAAILNQWIAQAEGKLGPDAKGGTLLQRRLPAMARPTKDVDGLVRGDLDTFLLALEDALAEPWGPLTLRRGEAEVVNVPTKIIKPRRFAIIIALRVSVGSGTVRP